MRLQLLPVPVVVIDRNISNKNFTAFVGGNNLEVGKTVGNIFNKKFENQPAKNILEITGLKNSSPAQERLRGFSTTAHKDKFQNKTIIDCGWHYSVAFSKLDSLYKIPGTSFDFVFAHNDEMALRLAKSHQDTASIL